MTDQEKTLTVGGALKHMKKEFANAGLPEPGADAEFLLTHLLGCKRHELYINAGRELTGDQAERLGEYISRRIEREPAQYITGETEFLGRAFRVTHDVLVPRPETELLVEEAVEFLKGLAVGPGERLTAIDLCTGSGCIAVTLAIEVSGLRVLGTDISGAAIGVAEENALTHGVRERVEFLEGDLFEPIKELGIKADLIVTNPPYVPTEELARLEPEVRDFEPREALDGGREGLDYYRMIIPDGAEYLKPGGMLIAEIGFGQAGELRKLAAGTSLYEAAVLRKDFAGIERILKLKRRG